MARRTVEKLILDYVKKAEFFDVPQYNGGYDEVPFTHKQYIRYINKLVKKYADTLKYVSSADQIDHGIIIHAVAFEFENTKFLLRRLEMGEYVDQLMTLDYYQNSWSQEYGIFIRNQI